MMLKARCKISKENDEKKNKLNEILKQSIALNDDDEKNMASVIIKVNCLLL